MKHLHSLRAKIIGIFCLCVIVPLLCINIITLNRYQQSLERSTVDAYEMLSDQIETNLDTYLSSIKRVSLYPYYNNEIQSILYDISILNDRSIMTKENSDIMSDFLFNMLIQDKNIQSVFFTDLEGNVLYNKSNGGYYRSTDYFQTFIQIMEQEFMVIPTHNQSYVNRARKNVFSYIRVIKEVNTNTPIGYAILEINSSVILNMIEKISDVSDEYIAITLEDGSLLNSNIPEEMLAAFQQHMNQWNAEEEENRVEIDGKKYLLSRSEKSDNHLVTWIYQNEDEIMGSLNQMARLSVGLILVISAAVLIVTVLASRKLTDPLVHLRDAMVKVRSGNFNAKVETYGGKDEVSELSECYNSMLIYIDDLITREYKLQIQERDANLKALQNQINPHFLYNTLESITMMAEINDDMDVAEMVTNLGEFMRFSLTAKDTMVFLCDELACVENYIRIQNVRFNNKISLSMECDEKLLDFEIAKMSIQPIVENSILHGIEPGAKKIHVMIRVQQEKGILRIWVKDDGKGMDEETLATVVKNLDQDEELYQSRHSIGLRNVHQRLKLRYGEMYGLSFESEIGKGTTVMLQLPGKQGEK